MEKGKAKQSKPYYGAVLKWQVIHEYESGACTKEALPVKYGILGSKTILGWHWKYVILEGDKFVPNIHTFNTIKI